MMKTRTIIIILSALALSCFSASAQVAVNGVEVFTKMTKSEVVAKFGEPDKYKVYDSGDNGVDEWYHYSKSRLVFKEKRLVEFVIRDKKYSLTLYGLDVNVSVGDNFSILSPLNPHYMDWFEKDWYCVYYEEFDESIRFLVKNGLIECVSFSTSFYVDD